MLHVIPLAAIAPGAETIDVSVFERKSVMGYLRTIMGGFSWWRYNFDGIVTLAEGWSGKAQSYLQLFRSGAIEAVDMSVLGIHDPNSAIPSTYFEQHLIEATREILAVENFLGLQPPFVVMLTLVGVQGKQMATSGRANSHPIDRSILEVPSILVEDPTMPSARILQPAFDAVWNAAGFMRSPNFNDEGAYQHDR